MEIYVLMADYDGTMRSRPMPTGVALTDEYEAKMWVKSATLGYSRDYERVTVYSSLDEVPRHT